ncbi:MAG: MMPL family transporter [Pseudomonadales bacterium]|nr:MMPL family transporter [Pseudomonadales bacterium]
MSLEKNFASQVIKHRVSILIASVIIVIASVIGAKHLVLSTDSRIYFGPDNPQLLDFEKLEDTFTKARNILILIHSPNEAIFSPNKLKLVNDLTEESWTVPHSYRVDSVTNFQHSEAEDDDLVTANLIDFLEDQSLESYKKLEEIALDDAFISGRLISLDGKTTGINILVSYPEGNPEAALEATRYTRVLRDKYREQYPDTEIYLTGVTLIDSTFAESVMQDSTTLIPIMYGVIILLLLFLLKSAASVISIILLVILASASAFGIAGQLGIMLNPTSSSASIVIMTVAVAHCVHLFVTFFNLHRDGDNYISSLTEALRINVQPIFLTSVTTAIGFLSLNLSDVPPMQDFGNIVAIGVAYATFFVLFTLPAAISYVPLKARVIAKTNTKFLDSLADFVIANQTKLLWVLIPLSFVIGLLSPLNTVNDQFTKFFDKDLDFSIAADFADTTLGGAYSIEYVLESGKEQGITSPEYLQKVDEFALWLRQQPEVMHVTSITDIMKKLNKNMHGDEETQFKLPESKELASQFLLLYEMSLPYGLDLNTYTNYNKSASKLSVSVPSLQTSDFLALQQRSYQWLKQNAPEPMHYEGSGVSLMFSHIGFRAMTSSIKGAAVALVLISTILLFALRSTRLGLISLLPNMLPAAIGFGIWGVFSGNIGMALSPVLGITLGIVVDDTVHFLSKYKRAIREQGLHHEDAIRYAFHNVGIALWVTTFVLTSGFLIFTFGVFVPNRDLGLMAAQIIFVALILDFLLLPALLMRFAKKS